MYTHTHTHTHTACTRTYTHTHTRIHAHTHTHTHTWAHNYRPPNVPDQPDRAVYTTSMLMMSISMIHVSSHDHSDSHDYIILLHELLWLGRLGLVKWVLRRLELRGSLVIVGWLWMLWLLINVAWSSLCNIWGNLNGRQARYRSVPKIYSCPTLY